ncbi:hypothetical protein Dda_2675 [Drechslerella dactyloides]|uniref:HNH nuclease domain-containing protein n=1 Tax=Drechslerella dactyloides TaxID=74499 RepID=A0AAD6J0F7_DREDA|nr:hypothetical protein Dda_2675 [Drechslerella dactyloides]
MPSPGIPITRLSIMMSMSSGRCAVIRSPTRTPRPREYRLFTMTVLTVPGSVGSMEAPSHWLIMSTLVTIRWVKAMTFKPMMAEMRARRQRGAGGYREGCRKAMTGSRQAAMAAEEETEHEDGLDVVWRRSLAGAFLALSKRIRHKVSRNSEPARSTFPMLADRAEGRNVFIYDSTNPSTQLGGLYQCGSITEANLLLIISILITTSSPIDVLHRQSNHILTNCNRIIDHGAYDIYCEEPVEVTDEQWIPRSLPRETTSANDSFRDKVRQRDGRCVFSGLVNLRAYRNSWVPFTATHIVPLHCESWWAGAHGDMHTQLADGNIVGTEGLDTPQNGLLLQQSIVADFADYTVSVIPEASPIHTCSHLEIQRICHEGDGYKIVLFAEENYPVDGKNLDPICLNPDDPNRVHDDFLRWHFRQAVLANVRGNGEPVFEHDFAGMDQLAEMAKEPYSDLRIGFEVDAWLRNKLKVAREKGTPLALTGRRSEDETEDISRFNIHEWDSEIASCLSCTRLRRQLTNAPRRVFPPKPHPKLPLHHNIYLSINPTITMAEQTPRVNAPLLANFTTQTVRIAGKVIQIRGSTATIESQGTVAIQLDADTNVKTQGNVVEIIGKVNSDHSIKEFVSTDFGPDVDMAAVDAVVHATHTFREIFYDAK